MRQIFILAITTLTMNAFLQIDVPNAKIVFNSDKSEKIGKDTILQVSYVNPDVSEKKPAYYINGKLIGETILGAINPQLIDSMNVVKRDVEVDGKKYYGQIYIQLKKDYHPRLISLTEIKLKLTKPINAPSIFIIDNKIISGDYSKHIVDENYILRIIVEKIENKEENLQVNMIRLLTKTEENIKNSKQIWIRGTEDLIHEK
jgi:hypothetical protein